MLKTLHPITTDLYGNKSYRGLFLQEIEGRHISALYFETLPHHHLQSAEVSHASLYQLLKLIDYYLSIGGKIQND